MGDGWTEVTIRGVVIDPMTGDPTILLEDAEETAILAVAADPSVAGAIISELEGIDSERSKTLFYRFLVRHDVAVTHVELARGVNGDPVASLHYRHQGESYSFDARPIDAMLVAVQMQSPIYAHHELITHAPTAAAPRVQDGRDLLILSRPLRP